MDMSFILENGGLRLLASMPRERAFSIIEEARIVAHLFCQLPEKHQHNPRLAYAMGCVTGMNIAQKRFNRKLEKSILELEEAIEHNVEDNIRIWFVRERCGLLDCANKGISEGEGD